MKSTLVLKGKEYKEIITEDLVKFLKEQVLIEENNHKAIIIQGGKNDVLEIKGELFESLEDNDYVILKNGFKVNGVQIRFSPGYDDLWRIHKKEVAGIIFINDCIADFEHRLTQERLHGQEIVKLLDNIVQDITIKQA